MQTGFETVLIGLDIGASGALLRILLGVLLVAVVMADPEAGFWMMSALLLVMLFGVKVIAVVARRVVQASAMVRSHWEWRRDLARNYDSYQWRKLLWYGVGITMGGAFRWPGTRSQWALGAVCLAAGGVAEILWRRHRLSLVPPAS